MELNRYVVAASDISIDTQQANEIYFSVSMRMLTTETNLNGVRVTEGFIDDIVANADIYTCMPLTADVNRLRRREFKGLTHLFDAKTQTFEAEQIGAFYSIRKQNDEHGVSLIGTARINKRDAQVVQAVQDLYDSGAQKFSFEIYAAHTEEVDGVTVVDAAEGNRLTAMAIVTTPAYPAATALSLAAELSLDAIRDKLWRMLYERFSDRYYDVMQVGADYALLYFPDNGTYQRAEFEVGSADIVLKDVYEVRFERVEKVNEMENVENTVVEIDVKLATAEVEIAETVEDKTEEVTEYVTVAVDEPQAVEVAEVQAETVQDEEANEVERLKAELEEARKQILEANEAFENYKKAAVEAAEAAAKKEKMVAFAQKLRLNMEDEAVAQAIEANDYEALAAQVENVESASVQYTIAAEMDTRPYGSMFDRT